MTTWFPIKFLVFWMAMAVCTLLFLSMKQRLCAHLSPRRNYQLGRLYLVLLGLPILTLVPGISRIFSVMNLLILNKTGPAFSPSLVSVKTAKGTPALVFDSQWFNDFAVPVWRSLGWEMFGRWILPGMIAAGILLFLLPVVKESVRLEILRKQAAPLSAWDSPKVFPVWEAALELASLKRRPVLLASCQVHSPLSFGILRPAVMIPQDWELFFTQKDLEFMLLHELAHLKQKDPLTNLLSCLFRCIYWFHPLVGRTVKSLQKDQETACDQWVLDLLAKDGRLAYGSALLSCAAHLSGAGSSPMACTLCREESSLKNRILQIAAYKKESPSQKRRGRCLFTIALAGVLLLSPVLCGLLVSAQSLDKDAAPALAGETLVENPAFAAGLGDFQGAFVLYDARTQEYQVSDSKAALLRCAPQSTYKIYSALFALDQNLITPQDSLCIWDKQPWPFQAWNQDQTLDTAMAGSVNWYFQGLDSRQGKDTLNSYFHRISYGNQDLSGSLSAYWLDGGSLEISPLEQTRLLKQLWENRWGFEDQDIQAVKKALLVEKSSRFTLYGKTGTGNVNGETTSGWFIGILETQDQIYPFACLIQGSEGAQGTKAAEIARRILMDYTP